MSGITYLAVAAALLVGSSYVAWRWKGVQPEPPPPGASPSERLALLEDFAARQAPANVARWRRTIPALILYGWSIVWVVTTIQAQVEDNERAEIRRNVEQCENRGESRDDVRNLAVAMVDEVADYAEVPDDERDLLISRAQTRAVAELPPPVC